MMNKLNENKGFTLIELMIVIAIIGILAAIAIPQFSAYRKRSYDAAAQADLRNAATAQEAYYVDWNIYTADFAALSGEGFGFFKSKDIEFDLSTATVNTYVMKAWHPAGNYSYRLTGPGGYPERY